MLGEILGRSAGDTCTELTLLRFLLLRGSICGVRRALGPEDPGVSSGLCRAETPAVGLAKMGDGRGWKEVAWAEFGCSDGDTVALFVCVMSGETGDFWNS